MLFLSFEDTLVSICFNHSSNQSTGLKSSLHLRFSQKTLFTIVTTVVRSNYRCKYAKLYKIQWCFQMEHQPSLVLGGRIKVTKLGAGVLNIIASGWEKCSQNDNNTILKNYRRILEQFSRMYVGKLVKFKILNDVALLQHKKRASILETCWPTWRTEWQKNKKYLEW